MAIVYDIRIDRDGLPRRSEPPAPPSALAQLIAEERAAWRRETETDGAQAAASALMDRVVNWIPKSLDEAIRLLEFGVDEGSDDLEAAAASVLAGLRIIASAGDPRRRGAGHRGSPHPAPLCAPALAEETGP
jgi:hypothetical protein